MCFISISFFTTSQSILNLISLKSDVLSTNPLKVIFTSDSSLISCWSSFAECKETVYICWIESSFFSRFIITVYSSPISNQNFFMLQVWITFDFVMSLVYIKINVLDLLLVPGEDDRLLYAQWLSFWVVVFLCFHGGWLCINNSARGRNRTSPHRYHRRSTPPQQCLPRLQICSCIENKVGVTPTSIYYCPVYVRVSGICLYFIISWSFYTWRCQLQ